jgi:hypothetical protein
MGLDALPACVMKNYLLSDLVSALFVLVMMGLACMAGVVIGATML